MADFDPTSIGAVAVDDFDPTSLGAVAVEEFDPTSLGAIPVESNPTDEQPLIPNELPYPDMTPGVPQELRAPSMVDPVDIHDRALRVAAPGVAALTLGPQDLGYTPEQAARRIARTAQPGIAAAVLGPDKLEAPPSGSFRADMQSPLVRLPRPSGDGIGAGIASGAIDIAEGLTSLENLATIAPLTGAAKSVERVAQGIFSAQMAEGVTQASQAAVEAQTPGERARAITAAVLGAGLTGLAGRGAFTAERVAPKQVAEPPPIPGQPPPLPRPEMVDAETLDGLLIARDRLSRDMAEQPPEVQQQRTGTLSEINELLRGFDQEAVKASEARVRATQEAAAPDTQGPPAPPAEPLSQTEQSRSPTASSGDSSTASPESNTPPRTLASSMEAAEDFASRIADEVASGQPTTVRDVAYHAARDNAQRQINASETFEFNPDFLRKSAMTAVQKAAREQPTSLDAPVGDDATTRGDVLPDEAQRSPAQAAALSDIADVMADIRKGFKDERLRTALDSFDQRETLEQLGARLGMTKEGARGIQKKAMLEMRREMEKRGIMDSTLGFSLNSKPVDWLASNLKRLFSAEGNLPREVFDRWGEREAQVKSISRDIAYTSRDLYDAVAKEYGISRTERFTKGFQNVPPADVRTMNDALAGQIPIETLRPALREPILRMRQQVDTLSQQLLDSGLIDGDLAAKVEGNLGTYLTRSYRIFDDPKWAEQIPQQVRNRARAFLLEELRAKNPAATDMDASRLMNSMLQDWKDSSQHGGMGKLGSKDMTSLIKRKDIAPEIRELMGEYRSPVANFARSVSKMANLLGSQRFLADVRKMGEGKWLFEDGKQRPGYDALIAAEGSDVMAPLNGLRTTPEIAEAFREFQKIQTSDSPWARAFATLTAAAKTAKTVGSLMTQARNLFGQVYFFAMNGHYDLRPLKDAVMGTAADIGAISDPKWRAYYRKMLDLGVVDQSAKAGELRDALKDAGLNDANLAEFGDKVFLKNIKKSTVDAAIRGYQVSDDIGKMVGFANESKRLKEINPDWTLEQVEKEAAKRIRDTYPTYSMVPLVIRQFQRQPVLGPFTSFAAESMRTMANALSYTAQDLRSSNPKARKAGAQRLAGQLAVLAGGFGLTTASRALLGIREEEERDANRFLPPWDKDAQLLYTGKGDGKLSYVNLSFANPYSYAPDALNSFINGLRSNEDIGTAMGSAFAKAMSPFTSENIMAGAMLDLARNRTQSGRQLYSKADSAGDIVGAWVKHIAQAIEPGTATRLRKKIIPAIKGETTPQGAELSPAMEIANELTGVKQQTTDYRQALGFKALQFARDENDSESAFRRVGLRRGSVDDADVKEAYEKSERARFETWKGLYGDMRAAMRRGVSQSEATAILKEFGVPAKSSADILRGRYVPYVPSPESVRKSGKPLPALKSPYEGKSLAD